MSFSLVQITSTFIALFIIIDILGAIPILIGLKEKGIQIKSLSVSVVSFVILLIFLFAGDWILQLFNVDIQSFAVAGSLVIFIFAIEMVLDVEIYKNRGPEGSASFVPIAFPLVAGPASFTTLLSLRAAYDVQNIIVALVINIIWVYLVLKFTGKIEKFFGKGGIYIMRKFFGIILLAISVKLFTENIGSLLK
ncbi:MAG: MarC family protein [Paludibacteraceae bacterium]|nr:MarC family protein [Paludibacteraceae bacterium]